MTTRPMPEKPQQFSAKPEVGNKPEVAAAKPEVAATTKNVTKISCGAPSPGRFRAFRDRDPSPEDHVV